MIRLFRVFIPASVLTALVCDAILLFGCFVAAVYLVIDLGADLYLTVEGGLERILVVVASFLAGMYLSDLYEEFRIRSRIELVQRMCVVTGGALLFQALLGYLDPDWMMPRWMMMAGSLLALCAVSAWRIAFATVGLKVFGATKLLYAGLSQAAREAARRFHARPEFGFQNLGYVDDENRASDEVLRWLGPRAELKRVASELKPDRIVVPRTGGAGGLAAQTLLELRLAGMRVIGAAELYELAYGRVCLSEIQASELVLPGRFSAGRGAMALRDAYSWLIALAGLTLALPLLAVVAIAVKLTSKGPVFYRQVRIGMGGRPFVLYKFRSMREDAESASGAVWAAKDDPRVTAVGKWLRRYRLDEFPQLINVLKGEMAIVGPRPERPEFVAMLAQRVPFYQQRHAVKPGITGWAQINHEYGDSIQDAVTKLEYDLYYIRNLSPYLDAYITFHTLKVMLLGRGAH